VLVTGLALSPLTLIRQQKFPKKKNKKKNKEKKNKKKKKEIIDCPWG